MSRPTMADLIVHGAIEPLNDVVRPIALHCQRALQARAIPVIVCDNVAEYVDASGVSLESFKAEDWPSLAPTWSIAWLEYGWRHDHPNRTGVWVQSIDLRHEEVAPADVALIVRCQNEHPERDLRWIVATILFSGDGRRVTGPLSDTRWVLDEYGRVVDCATTPFQPGDARIQKHDAAHNALHQLHVPAFQTIAFTHCRNVQLESHSRDPKAARAYQKRHKQEPVRWQTIRLVLPRKHSEASAEGTSDREIASGLHIVMGHFAHYGDCCPGQHPPRGQLFGKLDGIYWMRMHLRGDPNGEIKSDRVVVLDESGLEI